MRATSDQQPHLAPRSLAGPLAPERPRSEWLLRAADARRRGRPDEALSIYLRLLATTPADVEALYGAALLSKELGNLDQAEALCGRGQQADPVNPDFWNLQGTVAWDRKRGQDALGCLDRAATLRSEIPQIWFNRGIILTGLGDIEGAIAAYERALALEPHYFAAAQNLVFLRDVASDGPEMFEERRRFAATFAAPFAAGLAPHPNDRTVRRRLRIGYVSGDFWIHSAAFIFCPVILAHDWDEVQVYCYSNQAEHIDPLTEVMRNEVKWRFVKHLTDAELAEVIRLDRIDILMDLSGFSNGTRYLVFARKPAPVQVTAWGHALGTGLPTMDALFADPIAAPLATRDWFTERVWDLPNLMAYQAPAIAPPVAGPPAGPITFGSFNRLMKLSPRTLDWWAEILLSVPDSRLLLKYGSYDVPDAVLRLRAEFHRRRVDPDRVFCEGSTSQKTHLERYAAVDLSLDPYPHGGGMTTLESLLMGVPVLTCAGPYINSRTGISVLTAVGMPEWVTTSGDEYVRGAIDRVRARGSLAEIRGGLRERLLRSPICQIPAYTRAVEAVYRRLWLQWLAKADKVPA